uniref:Uncharacterized protein n=1 Tax=Arundo donax TaxID=35708 RepID=A0A0A9GMP5_ARUDO
MYVHHSSAFTCYQNDIVIILCSSIYYYTNCIIILDKYLEDEPFKTHDLLFLFFFELICRHELA